ncbi:cell surface protein SprA [candidate division KSB1 bacterium]
MVYQGLRKILSGKILPAIFLTANGIGLFCPSPGYAQINLQYDMPQSWVVQYSVPVFVPNGLGIGRNGIPNNPEYRNTIFRETVFDEETGYYIVTEKVRNYDLSVPLVMERERFIEFGRQQEIRRLWHEATLRSINPVVAAQAGPGGVNITIPVPIQSEALSRIVGSSDISLQVNGEVDIRGNLVKNDYGQVKDIQRGSDYSFKLEQTQRFNITGMIGQKISVLVDQNSERDFDIQNNIRILYDGDEDEIFQSIEAGNVSLSLPGAQLITFSGRNQGLFGFKTTSKIGDLNITSIASLERGQKNSIKLSGGAKSTSRIIKDYDFLEGTYFFVDDEYRESYGFAPNGLLITDPANAIDEFEVWLAQPRDNQQADSEEAWAVLDPETFIPDTLAVDNESQTRRFFRRQEANIDYVLNKDLGYFIMNRRVNRGEVLAIAYTTMSGKIVGDLDPPLDRPFVLKLIRTQSPLETDPTWRLEWRNVYSVGNEGIDPSGFEMHIVNNREPERPTIQNNNGRTFIDIFGFDRFNESGAAMPDNKVDEVAYLFDFIRGHIIFPSLRPFDPPDDPFTSGASALDDELRVPEIYDRTFPNPAERTGISKFDIEVSFSDQSATFDLGVFNVITGSEEVFYNGQPMTRGIDYEIDYLVGKVTILNSAALAPGADLEIKFESAEIFQLDKKTMFGSRIEYALSENAFFGASALFLNENTIENRVIVGQEPIKNLVWGANTRMQHSSEFLTSMFDKLPMLEATVPTNINFEGEFAQSRPNPNTMDNGATGDPLGVAYVDDFEGSKRITYLGKMRKEWTRGSRPKFFDPFSGIAVDAQAADRVKMNWYNPYKQLSIKEIFPKKEVNSRTHNLVNVLNIKFIRDSKGFFPAQNAWGSIMKALTPGSFNQTESKYLEVWVKGQQGALTLDLGLISEDAIENNILNSEDLVLSPFPDGILEDAEDVGLDMVAGVDGANSVELYGDDDWNYVDGSFDYTNINGTEGSHPNLESGQKGDGARIPDTEDINGNGSLDTRNAYYQYTIFLGDDNPVSGKYIAGGQIGEENDSGWRLYRIPLREFTGKIGDPVFSRIEFARLSVRDLEENQEISIYEINIVGNRWLELGTAQNDTLVQQVQYQENDSLVIVESVNTEENPDYFSPPGVEGLIDPITRARAREQALKMNFIDLMSGQSAAIRQTFLRDQNLIHYQFLKMFVYGDPALFLSSDTSNVEIYVQLMRDQNNYYEIRKRIYPGWNDVVDNEFKINLYELPLLKSDLYKGHRVFDSGEEWSVKGSPSISAIRQIIVGVKNLDTLPVTGFIWIDELRVSEVDRSTGQAYRASLSMQLSDLGSLSLNFSNREADFHTLSEQFGTGNNQNTLSMNSSLNLSRLVAPLSMFNIPLNVSYSKSDAAPKWLRGSDILYDPGVPEASVERRIQSSKSYSANVSKTTQSGNFLINKTIDALSFGFQHQESTVRDVTNEKNDSWSNRGNVNYNLQLPTPSIRPLMFLGSSRFVRPLSDFRFTLLPTRITTAVNANQSGSELKLRTRRSRQDTTKTATATILTKNYNLQANRTFSTTYTPFPTVTTQLNRSSSHDLSHVKDVYTIASELFNDSTQVSANQSFNVDFKPTILQWLSPGMSYNSSYNVSRSRALGAAGKSANNNAAINTRLSFNPLSLVNLVYKSGVSPAPSTTQIPPGARPPGRRPPGQPEQQPPEEEEPQEETNEPMRVNPLYYIERFSARLSPIQFILDNSRSSKHAGLEGPPKMNFQFGFTTDPGVGMLENIGRNVGSETTTRSLSTQTRLSITSDISVNLSYANAASENNQGNTKTGSSSHTIVAFKDKRLPLPRYTVNVNNLQNLFILSRVANSVTYNLTYDGRQSENWRETPDNIQSKSFDWGYRPLVGINVDWKHGIRSSFQMSKSNTLRIDKLKSETKTTQSTMSLSTGFSWNTGLTIPLLFFGTKRIENSVQFNMAFNKTENETFMKPPGATGFQPKSINSNWSFRPTLSYSFSTRVTGSMFFEYRKNKNLRIGEDSSKDFGLQVLIRISGN